MKNQKKLELENLKKNQRMYILIFILLVFSVVLNRRDYNISYKNKDLGFEMRLPRSWKNRYIIKEKPGVVYFYNKKNYDYGKDKKGLLFKIRREKGQLISANDIYYNDPNERLITSSNGYSYIISFPSTLQYDKESKDLRDDYSYMVEDIYGIVDRIKPIKIKAPKSKYRRYKSVGSYYFQLDLPKSWKLRNDLSADSIWNIYDGRSMIGSLELVPNHKEYLNEKGKYMKLIKDEKNNRTYKLTLEDKIKYKDTMEVILESIEIKDGNYNSIDIINENFEEIEAGGYFLSAYIGDMSLSGEQIDSINIKLGGEKDHKRLEYPVAEDAKLISINGDKINLYENYDLDYSFFEEVDNVFENTYDFIIDKNMELIGIINLSPLS